MEARSKVKIAIFASGTGTNARELIKYFRYSDVAVCSLLLSNNPGSGIFPMEKEFSITAILLKKEEYRDGVFLSELMEAHEIDIIVLAGYLKLIPSELISKFPQRIVNIHPSLLPRHGGKGMYGMKVHNAVIAAKDKHAGMTIHYVNEIYDSGEVIFQYAIPVDPAWSAEDLRLAIQKLEHKFYPQMVKEICQKLQASKK